MAAASVHVMSLPKNQLNAAISSTISHLNVGTGQDCSISELANTIRRVTAFNGDIVYDTTKPDGTQRKLLDITRIEALGWSPSIELEAGIDSVSYTHLRAPRDKRQSRMPSSA